MYIHDMFKNINPKIHIMEYIEDKQNNIINHKTNIFMSHFFKQAIKLNVKIHGKIFLNYIRNHDFEGDTFLLLWDELMYIIFAKEIDEAAFILEMGDKVTYTMES